jgi:hypothetical protein
MKRHHTIFHARVGPIHIRQKERHYLLHQTCVFASDRIRGHVVNSDVSRVQNVDALFFMLGRALCSFYKKRARTCYAELAFLNTVGCVGNVVHFAASGAET